MFSGKWASHQRKLLPRIVSDLEKVLLASFGLLFLAMLCGEMGRKYLNTIGSVYHISRPRLILGIDKVFPPQGFNRAPKVGCDRDPQQTDSRHSWEMHKMKQN